MCNHTKFFILMEKCEICKNKFDNRWALSHHLKKEHNIDRPQYILQIKYNGVKPTCLCGCGSIMEYNKVLDDFPKYIKKHLGKIQEGKTSVEIFGDPNSPKRRAAISKGLKKGWEEGKYDNRLEDLKKPRTQEVKDKISKANTGKKHTEEFKKNVSIRRTGTTHTDETKEKMSQAAIKNLLKTGKVKKSKLEITFSKILKLLGIKYKQSYFIPEIKKIYDFKLLDYNILIECDGDFYHCNPEKFPEPIYEVQKINLKNDIFKNQWAKDNGYILLRFWETDINNNPEKIITELKKYL